MTTVQFNFRDSRGRPRSRSVHHTSNILVDIVSDISTLAGLWNPLTDLAFEGATISFADPSSAFAGAAVSNKDENTSVTVRGSNGINYDFDLPDMPDAKMPTELLDLTDVDVVAFFAQFATPNAWRINLHNPQEITALIRGKLDE